MTSAGMGSWLPTLAAQGWGNPVRARGRGGPAAVVRMFGMDERYYFAYIVASRSLTLYVGMTGNLKKRVFEHKRKLYEGFSATSLLSKTVISAVSQV